MLSLQNARSSRNRILAVRCAVIILLCGALLMISAISTTRVRAQGQSAAGKFRRVVSNTRTIRSVTVIELMQ